MFLVEAGSGMNKGYATASELGAAIRRGELGPQARIYHRATDRWLPLTVHPEYRKAAAEREERSGRELRGRQWTFMKTGRGTDAAPDQAPGDSASGPLLIPGDPAPSWLGSTVRRIRGLGQR
jgi:hypothetical protein